MAVEIITPYKANNSYLNLTPKYIGYDNKNDYHTADVSFGARIPTARKKEILEVVNNFITNAKIPSDTFIKVKNKLGRIFHPICGIAILVDSITSLLKGDMVDTAIDLGFSLFNLGYEKLFHNIAIRKVRTLSKQLIKQGFSEEERIYAVKKYLNRDGSFIYSKIFNVTSPNKVNKLANAQEVKQVGGLISYIHLNLLSLNKATARFKKARLTKSNP